jgi:preprotein translocase subunit SecD
MTCGSQSTQGIRDKASDYLATCDQSNPVKYLLDPATVVGTDVARATATQTTQGLGGWEVDLTFTSEGTKKFGDLTAQAVTATPPANQVAIVLDGLVVSSPVIQTAIPGGTASITGNFTQQQATDLANVLKYGALPLSLEIGQITSVSPSLGSDALSAGLLAGLIGLIAVGIFVLIYYRFLGLVAIASLTVAGALTYLAMCLLGNYASFTLTLAGVTGAIVAIGITADSFVVYFERIRDELREGRNLRAAVSFGWVRARRTIITADAVSLLAATVLYLMSTGSVRGFAFTLGLTTVVDLLVVFAFTRPLMTILANGRLIDPSAKWSGLSKVRRPQEMVKRHA